MRDIKGFTLVEAMLGMLILAVIVAGTLSFFVLWSSRSTETFRYKAADEASATAIGLITADLRKAGFGVTKSPEYAIFVVDNGSSNPDELYVNYGDYLNLEGDIRAPTSDTLSVPFRSINSVFKQSRTFTVSGDSLSYQGMITLDTSSSFLLRAMPAIKDATRYSAIGAVITSASSVADVNINGTSCVTGQIPGTQDWTFPLVNPGKDASGNNVNVTAGMTVAPAVSYKVITGTTGVSTGALWRNRGSSSAPFGTAIMGGTPFVDVTNFQIECLFSDGTTATTNTTPASIRSVEVTLSYRVLLSRDYKVDTKKIYGWGPKVQRKFRVTPRSIAIADQM